MTNANKDSWQSGVDKWWGSMDVGRRWLEDLGKQVQSTAERSVQAEDLGPVLDALEMMERRVQGVGTRIDALDAKVDGVLERLSDLTSVIEVLADRVSAR